MVPERDEYTSAYDRFGALEPDVVATGSALFRTRTIFSENRKAAMERNLRTGKINTKVLGRRAPIGDDHLFQKRRVPSEKSYFVLIGLDLSGSTRGRLSHMIRSAALNQATLLHGAGIKFAMYGHSGSYATDGRLNVDFHVVKEPRDRWNDQAIERLNACQGSGANLDGHTLEVYRKITERERADKKLIMYYTDGAMPCENYDEEKYVLEREIVLCRRMGIEIVGVGVENDDPTQYGLETVRIDGAEEINKVLDELERKIQR